jgi:phosphoglycerate dehydrogenase-like enzyme
VQRKKGLYALDPENFERIYGPDEQRDISQRIEIQSRAWSLAELRVEPSKLRDAEVIFSGWGGPQLDEAFLKAAPNLKVVFYGAGTTQGVITPAAWDRQVQVTSAYAANGVPVAEYSLAVILFSLKHGFRFAREMREAEGAPKARPLPGGYGSTIGLISLGVIGRYLLKLLVPFDLNVVVYDPFVSPEEATKLSVKLVSLDEVFRTSDVVSLHTPLLAETKGMITGAHLRSLKSGATFLNTSRGAVVREDELIAVLKERPDLQAVLDVTDPEPPTKGSALYKLPNVALTPHIAGSKDNECRRMGRAMVDELDRYLAGKPLQWEVTRELAKRSSHRPVG